MITRGKAGRGREERVKCWSVVMKENLTWGGEHMIQCTVDVLNNYIPEIYITLLTDVTPINSI